jgi:uracil-DNA glycosylase
MTQDDSSPGTTVSKLTKQQQLKDLYQKLEQVAPSLPLATTLEDIVPGEGNPAAEVILIGEAPGANEQQQRRPFVGRSGQLLRKVLAEIGLPPAETYIANIVKARPPENRDPSPAEIKAYQPYLDEEINIIKPTLIVTLGRFSMAKFLPDVRISQVHGKLHRMSWQEKTLYVLPMYHPAAALRGTKIKNIFTDDMRKIPKAVAWIKENRDTQQLQDQVENILF